MGYVKVDKEEDADKTIIVSLPDASEWISIYDEEMEDQGTSKLNKLSSGLSKQFKTTALTILVNDSDLVYVGININGKLKDSISNLSKEIDFNKSKPNVWADILMDNYSFEDIKIAWKNKNLFVEDFLTEFAKYINLDKSKLLTGYNYIIEENSHEGITLNFALKEKKKTTALGLAKFKMLGGATIVDPKVGEKQQIKWILTNHGTSSNGVDVVIAGECIDKGLLIPEIVQTNYIKPQLDIQKEFKATFVESVATTGEKIFYARMEDFYIPKGIQPNYPMSPKEGKRYMNSIHESAIIFRISFIGAKEGNGEVKIFFSPLENRQEGTYYCKLMKGSIEDWMKKNSR
ncbi:hypothetical protein [Flavobacterium filum]|uniref:hypothetical protein n=1 Tax=Flavobacterium filum TaxID=370974 RepID=UPI0023F0C24D|nr:hypothetical protein [Flavobacterium filum]